MNEEHANEAPHAAPTETSVSAPAAKPQPYEQWAEQKHTAPWWVAGAAMHAGWAIGREVTEAEYDAAVSAAQHIEVR